MNSLMKLLISGLSLFVALAQANVPDYILNRAQGMGNASTLQIKARGSAITSPGILLKVGGVLFEGVLEDEKFFTKISSVKLTMHNNLGRFNIKLADGKTVIYEAPYWIFGPTIQYALDVNEYNAAVTLFGKPTEAEIKRISPSSMKFYNSILNYENIQKKAEECKNESKNVPSEKCLKLSLDVKSGKINPDSMLEEIDLYEEMASKEINEYVNYFFFAETHPAFNGNALGLRLIQADSLLIDPSYVEVISVGGRAAKYPGEVLSSNEENRILLGNAINETMQRCIGLAGDRYPQAWILTDVSSTYKLSIKGDHLNIEGSPYYYLWDSDSDENTNEIKPCTEAFKDLRSTFHNLAPLTWGITVQVAQLSAFLRGLKKSRPALANELASSKELNKFRLESITPRAWPKQKYIDFLKQ